MKNYTVIAIMDSNFFGLRQSVNNGTMFFSGESFLHVLYSEEIREHCAQTGREEGKDSQHSFHIEN